MFAFPLKKKTLALGATFALAVGVTAGGTVATAPVASAASASCSNSYVTTLSVGKKSTKLQQEARKRQVCKYKPNWLEKAVGVSPWTTKHWLRGYRYKTWKKGKLVNTTYSKNRRIIIAY